MRKKDAAATLTLILLLGSACCRVDDQQLVEKFFANRDSLEELQVLFEQDVAIVRLAPDFTFLEDNYAWPRAEGPGISEERWQRYRELFDRSGVTGGLVRRQSETVFIVEACGIVGSSRLYGYSYRPTSIPAELGVRLGDLEGEGRLYVPIADGWYLLVAAD